MPEAVLRPQTPLPTFPATRLDQCQNRRAPLAWWIDLFPGQRDVVSALAEDSRREINMGDDPGLFAMFGAALGLAPPWQVTSGEFDKLLGTLEVGLDFPRGARFACPYKDAGSRRCPVHDT